MKIEYQNIIQNAIKGDKSAISEIVKREENNIYSTLYYLNKNLNDINDIAQNVLLKLSSKIHQLKDVKYFKSWLNQIIINTYYDHLRKHKNIPLTILTDDDKKLEKPDYKNNPQEIILNVELDNIIKNSIINLPEQYKIPVALRELQGLSYDDISNITKTSIGTVKSRISRARAIIQDNIKKYTRE